MPCSSRREAPPRGLAHADLARRGGDRPLAAELGRDDPLAPGRPDPRDGVAADLSDGTVGRMKGHHLRLVPAGGRPRDREEEETGTAAGLEGNGSRSRAAAVAIAGFLQAERWRNRVIILCGKRLSRRAPLRSATARAGCITIPSLGDRDFLADGTPRPEIGVGDDPDRCHPARMPGSSNVVVPQIRVQSRMRWLRST
jgi:hypothetical protein